jgi:hypothetical protein
MEQMEVEFQIWVEHGSDGDEVTFGTGKSIDAQRRTGLIGADAIHIASIKARSYLDAMRKYYAAMGWGEYKPMLRDDGTPYPEDQAEFQ